jgi:acyl carrier protein
VTGRLKDLIIFCGANHYPQDIERTVERCHADLKAYGGAAFSVERRGQERLVVVHEIGRPKRVDLDRLLETIRRRLGEEHQIPVEAIILIRQGTLPKTSSGKTQRRECRECYLKGKLQVIAQWQEDQHQATDDAPDENGDRWFAEYVAPRNDTERLLAQAWSEVLGVRRVGIHDDFFDLGGNSILATQLISRLAPHFNVDIPLSSLFDRRTIAGLAELVEQASRPQQHDADLAELLETLETISEEEAERMLAEVPSHRTDPNSDLSGLGDLMSSDGNQGTARRDRKASGRSGRNVTTELSRVFADKLMEGPCDGSDPLKPHEVGGTVHENVG